MSTLVAQTISNGTVSTSSANVIQGSAKAWVNFNGVSSASIRASYNVSSVTRNATGDYTINFTNAFADTNYAVVGSCNNNSYFTDTFEPATYATSNVQINTYSRGTSSTGASATYDMTFVNVAVFR